MRPSKPAQSAASASWNSTSPKRASEWRLCSKSSEQLFLYLLLHRLHEVRRLARGCQLLGLFVGLFLLAVLVECNPLQRLIKDTPERLQPHLLRALRAALPLGRLFFSGGGLLRGGLGPLFSGLGFGAFLLATNYFGGHVAIKTWGDGDG